MVDLRTSKALVYLLTWIIKEKGHFWTITATTVSEKCQETQTLPSVSMVW